ncbi:MAG: serine protease [Candidatus Thorarchaeota archaeon]
MKLNELPRSKLEKIVVPLVVLEDQSFTDAKSVIEYQDEHGTIPKNQIIGTGTLISNEGINHIVTCKHVVDEAGNTLFAIMPHRSETRKGSIVMVKEFQDSLGVSWVLDTANDLALSAFPINPELWNVSAIPSSVFCEREKLMEGWDVFYFGYPAKQIDIEHQPAVRIGMISLVKHQAKHRFLIDAMAAGGNSGGPVLLRPMPLSVGNAPPMPLKTPFLGILSQTLENELELSPFDRLKYVAGLSIVVSADAILELFQMPNFIEHIETTKRNMK